MLALGQHGAVPLEKGAAPRVSLLTRWDRGPAIRESEVRAPLHGPRAFLIAAEGRPHARGPIYITEDTFLKKKIPMFKYLVKPRRKWWD